MFNRVRFSPSGKYLATVALDGTLQILDAASGSALHELQAEELSAHLARPSLAAAASPSASPPTPPLAATIHGSSSGSMKNLEKSKKKSTVVDLAWWSENSLTMLTAVRIPSIPPYTRARTHSPVQPCS